MYSSFGFYFACTGALAEPMHLSILKVPHPRVPLHDAYSLPARKNKNLAITWSLAPLTFNTLRRRPAKFNKNTDHIHRLCHVQQCPVFSVHPAKFHQYTDNLCQPGAKEEKKKKRKQKKTFPVHFKNETACNIAASL